RPYLVADEGDQRPGNDPLELAEWLFLENRSHLLQPCGPAFAKDELAHRPEASRGRLMPFLVDRLVVFQSGEPGQLGSRQAEDAAHFLVEIRAIRKRRTLLAAQQLGNVRLGH